MTQKDYYWLYLNWFLQKKIFYETFFVHIFSVSCTALHLILRAAS